MPWRVLANGAMLERVLGVHPTTKVEKTSTQIYREGAIIKEELAAPFVKRYDENDADARAVVERVEDSGEVDENGDPIYVAVGAPSSDVSAASQTDTEAVARAEAAEAQVTQLEGERDAASADLEQSKARIAELDQSLQEAETAARGLISYDDLSKAALEAEVADKELTVTRADGKPGDPLKSDLVSALQGGSSSPS